ncbi:MAG: M23 family metallopeptidase [Clostridia bacterium]
MFKISKIKKTLVHVRTWTKFTILIVIAAFFIVGAISVFYKPVYSVSLNGEIIGYSENKSELQERINAYIEKGNQENVAFVDIDTLPQYKLCFSKKDVETDDEAIFNKVVEQGTTYYKYYAITVNNEEKSYVASFEEAEKVVKELKEKNSSNKEKLGILEKYETELKEFTQVETCVANLYQKPVVTQKARSASVSSYTAGMYATGQNTSTAKVNLGISVIRPVSGVLTSRFGYRWGRGHKGIDIGASKGTPIKAAAGGTVTLSQYGYNGGYGNYVIVSHGNGVQTVYGHCSSLKVTTGQKVSQGQLIATVGSTGDSTGNHLHFEVRVNGVAQNPLNYVSY